MRSIDSIDPSQAVRYGAFVAAAYEMYEPGRLNPPPGPHFPAGYEVLATLQMSDTAVPGSRQFYGFVAARSADPANVVVALRGSEGLIEWWNDLHWALVPFDRVAEAGNVAIGFYDVYKTLGMLVPGQLAESVAAPSIAADIAAMLQSRSIALQASRPPEPVLAGHSLGAALITLLAIDLAAHHARSLPSAAYTFASPRVGDVAFATAYNALLTSRLPSYRIVNVVDVVPLFPLAPPYEHVGTEIAIDSLNLAVLSIGCNHALTTYLHVLDASRPLAPDCRLATPLAGSQEGSRLFDGGP